MLSKIKMSQADSDALKKNNGAVKTSLEVARVVGTVKFFQAHPNYEPPKRPEKK